MSLKCKGIFIVGAKRTPFCKHGGPLRELPASLAFAAAAKDAIHTANMDPALIDNTVVGNVHFLSQCDGGKTPRYCGTYSGVSLDKPALGVNKACGTGLQAVITGAVDILTGSSNVSLTGGTEIMSTLPFVARNVRFGTALGSSYQLEDYMRRETPDSHSGVTLQRRAEELGRENGIGREDADEYATQSRLKWKAAQESNVFADELTTLTVTVNKKQMVVDKDDGPKTLTCEELGQLPVLLDQGTVVTVGNCAAPADGASALLLANEDTVTRHSLRPLARVAGWACVGVDPFKGLGAVEATRRLLKDQGLAVGDVDLFEINETFATQVLVAARQLELDPSALNVNGGAIALGNPVAASGARMLAHLAHLLSGRNAKRAVAASDCGGGQGVAVMLEKI